MSARFRRILFLALACDLAPLHAKIAGGLLVNLQKGSSFIDERAFLNNEAWLPIYTEAHIGARVLLVKGFEVSSVTRYSDYKRFNVETLNTISRPKDADAPAVPQ